MNIALKKHDNVVTQNKTLRNAIVPMKIKRQTRLDCSGNLDCWNNEYRHTALTRFLENQIRQMHHGDRLPVVRDLMQRFKVSQSTLEHALRELENKHLIIRRRSSGIYVNQQDKRQDARHAIGVVVSDISDPFCALLVKGIERKLAAQNQAAIICNGQEGFQAELKAVHSLHGKIDGAIINATTNNVHNPDYVRYFSNLAQNREFPFLLVDIMIPGVNARFVGFDNFKAFFEMAYVLVGSKTRFQRVYYLGALECITGAERINGFRAGLRENHVSEEFLKIINVSLPVSEIFLPVDDLRGKRPSLIVSASPLILPKLLAFCGAQNLRIPEDVVVASVLEENFRDYIIAPVLGWVKPSVKLGELAVKLIQAIIAGKPARQITRIALERSTPKALSHIFD